MWPKMVYHCPNGPKILPVWFLFVLSLAILYISSPFWLYFIEPTVICDVIAFAIVTTFWASFLIVKQHLSTSPSLHADGASFVTPNATSSFHKQVLEYLGLPLYDYLFDLLFNFFLLVTTVLNAKSSIIKWCWHANSSPVITLTSWTLFLYPTTCMNMTIILLGQIHMWQVCYHFYWKPFFHQFQTFPNCQTHQHLTPPIFSSKKVALLPEIGWLKIFFITHILTLSNMYQSISFNFKQQQQQQQQQQSK